MQITVFGKVYKYSFYFWCKGVKIRMIKYRLVILVVLLIAIFVGNNIYVNAAVVEGTGAPKVISAGLCDSDSQCTVGKECIAFFCESCGSAPVCRDYVSTGGCGTFNEPRSNRCSVSDTPAGSDSDGFDNAYCNGAGSCLECHDEDGDGYGLNGLPDTGFADLVTNPRGGEDCPVGSSAAPDCLDSGSIWGSDLSDAPLEVFAIEIHPGATRLCNGLDNDCNGNIDEDEDDVYRAVRLGTSIKVCCGEIQCADNNGNCVGLGTISEWNSEFVCGDDPATPELDPDWRSADEEQWVCELAYGSSPSAWNPLDPELPTSALSISPPAKTPPPGLCCGNDPGEFLHTRDCRTSTSGACINPAVGDPFRDERACCLEETDCLFQGECYAAVGDTTVESAIIAVDTPFCGAFTSQRQCRGKSDLAKFRDEKRTVDERTARFRCKWEAGLCIPSANRATIHYHHVIGDVISESFVDLNGDKTFEVCVAASPGGWEDPGDGIITGELLNATGDPVIQFDGDGFHIPADVIVVGWPALTAQTDEFTGEYTITDVPPGIYDVQATGTPYGVEIVSEVQVYDSGTSIADFFMVHELGACNNDCTQADGLCHEGCQGYGACGWTPDPTRSISVQSACDLAVPGLIDDPDPAFAGQQILCCTGTSFTPSKANIEVCGDNVVSIRRPVVFKGKLATMVLTVFDSSTCNP